MTLRQTRYGSGEQIGFNTISDRLDAELFETFTEQYVESEFNYDEFKKITDKAKAIEYLASSFETNLTDIFNNLHLSQSLFIEKLQALVEYISNLLNSYCFDIKNNTIKPRNLKYLSQSIIGSENLKALRGLLIIRGFNDLLPSLYRIDSLPSRKVAHSIAGK